MASNWKGNQYRAQNAGGPPESNPWDLGAFLAGLTPPSGPRVTTSGGQLASGTRAAASPGFFKTLGSMGKVGRVAIPLAGALAIVDAATEFADTDDPVLRNAAEAAGELGGGFAGMAGGAALGAGLGSVVPIIGTGLGALLGGGLGYMGLAGAGKGLGAGVYDLLSGGEEGKRHRQAARDAQAKANIDAATRRTSLAVTDEEMLVKFLDDQRRAELDLRLKNDYNFANTANQGTLNAQNAATIQQLALLSGL